MTKRPRLVLIAAAMTLAISCATPPKAVPPAEPAPAPAPAPAPQAAAPASAPAAPAPDEERSKATALRKRAFDLGIKDVLPDDYAAADKSFADGNAAYGSDNAASAKSFEEAAAGFDAAISSGLPLISASARKNAEAMRDIALSKKADALFADLFAFEESELAKPAADAGMGDYEEAIPRYRAAANAYEALYKLCDASAVRASISSRDLAKWDTSNWNIAEAKFQASQDLFKTDAKASADSVDEAILRYGLALGTAYGYYAADRKTASETERDRAAGIKAEVAVKPEFDAALDLYIAAGEAQAAKDNEKASALFDQAAKAFTAAYGHAKQKMDTAKGELDSLDAAIATESSANSAR